MSKRTADTQLTRENNKPDLEQNSSDSGVFKLASDEVLQQRVIKKPKSRFSALNNPSAQPNSTLGSGPVKGPSKLFGGINLTQDLNTTTSSSSSSLFGAQPVQSSTGENKFGFGFGAFKPSEPPKSDSDKANAFSFFQKPASPAGTSLGSTANSTDIFKNPDKNNSQSSSLFGSSSGFGSSNVASTETKPKENSEKPASLFGSTSATDKPAVTFSKIENNISQNTNTLTPSIFSNSGSTSDTKTATLPSFQFQPNKSTAPDSNSLFSSKLGSGSTDSSGTKSAFAFKPETQPAVAPENKSLFSSSTSNEPTASPFSKSLFAQKPISESTTTDSKSLFTQSASSGFKPTFGSQSSSISFKSTAPPTNSETKSSFSNSFQGTGIKSASGTSNTNQLNSENSHDLGGADDYETSVENLNECFLSAVKKSINKYPSLNISSLFTQYKKFINELKVKYSKDQPLNTNKQSEDKKSSSDEISSKVLAAQTSFESPRNPQIGSSGSLNSASSNSNSLFGFGGDSMKSKTDSTPESKPPMFQFSSIRKDDTNLPKSLFGGSTNVSELKTTSSFTSDGTLQKKPEESTTTSTGSVSETKDKTPSLFRSSFKEKNTSAEKPEDKDSPEKKSSSLFNSVKFGNQEKSNEGTTAPSFGSFTKSDKPSTSLFGNIGGQTTGQSLFGNLNKQDAKDNTLFG
ncbi:hypothetical protein BB560_004625, partial [Smittium megazygosporum]